MLRHLPEPLRTIDSTLLCCYEAFFLLAGEVGLYLRSPSSQPISAPHRAAAANQRRTRPPPAILPAVKEFQPVDRTAIKNKAKANIKMHTAAGCASISLNPRTNKA